MPNPSVNAFELGLDALQPTQYCLSAGKLRAVCSWFDFDDPDYEPLPVARFDVDEAAAERADETTVEGRAKDAHDEWLLLDGHTRAVCALLAGERALRVRDATTDDDVDPGPYLTGRDWCMARGVYSVRDLVGETWSARRYEDEWLARCEEVFSDG